MKLVLRRAEQDLARFRIVLARGRGLNVGENFQRALHGRARRDSVEPLLYPGEFRPVDAVAFARTQPRKDRDVGDRVLRPGKVRHFGEPLLHDAVQPAYFVRIAVDRVLDPLGHGIAAEMAGLPHHGPDRAHLKHQPLQRDVLTTIVAGQQLPGSPRQVEQNRSRLENREGLSVRPVAVNDRGDLVVRADSQKLRFELLAGADVHRPDLVLEAGLLEHDMDLVPVGRGPSIDFDHLDLPFVCSVPPLRNSTEILVRPAGVEPTTPSLEGWCSIQFELRARVRHSRLGGGCRKIWSGWRDLNSRHLAPKASALPDCATPRGCGILRLRTGRGQRGEISNTGRNSLARPADFWYQIASRSRRGDCNLELLRKAFPPYLPKKGEEYLNLRQREHFKRVLEALKLELSQDIDRTVHAMQSDATVFADPNDRASQESDIALELRNRDRERKLIKKIDETIARIDKDDYGYCENCGIEIGLKRLEARPTATLCIDCKTLDELREKQVAK